MDQGRELTLQPVGRVVVGRPWPDAGDHWQTAVAEIEIDAAWAGALDGIEDFSHIWVMWWLDRAGGAPDALHVHPEGREELPLVGLFATRSPHRPNPVAITAVRLLGREGARLRVQGLDTYEGTPVLDIKPYLRRGDLIPEAKMAAWLEQLWRMHDEQRCRHDEQRRVQDEQRDS
jgi:tRNA-Thr(GGU) m(6)t(6)A37 methyltransferase TsaA